MSKFIWVSIGVALLAPVSRAADYPPAARESIEWSDVWLPHANETGLPRVLLIGDSITRAYFPEVEKRLAGKAYVGRLATSAFLSDPALLAQLIMVLDNTKFDVVHFNNGIHGPQHSDEEYRQAFPEFLATIRRHAPNAKLIWASTTSLKPEPVGPAAEPTIAADAKTMEAQRLMAAADLKKITPARIVARNAIALELVRAEGIPVDDLHALMLGHAEYYSTKDRVHFDAPGIRVQADQVVAEIAKLLPH